MGEGALYVMYVLTYSIPYIRIMKRPGRDWDDWPGSKSVEFMLNRYTIVLYVCTYVCVDWRAI